MQHEFIFEVESALLAYKTTKERVELFVSEEFANDESWDSFTITSDFFN
jgi:hypothetical protein